VNLLGDNRYHKEKHGNCNCRRFGWLSGRKHKAKHIITFMSEYRRGFGLEIEFIDHFNTRFVTTSNYNAIADLHTSQITRTQAKSFITLCLRESFPCNGF
jgi:hypothetical protein